MTVVPAAGDALQAIWPVVVACRRSTLIVTFNRNRRETDILGLRSSARASGKPPGPSAGPEFREGDTEMANGAEHLGAVIRRVLDAHGGLGTDVSALDAHTDLYDAGLTSFATVNIMLGLEDALDVEFPEQLLHRTTFSSIGQIQTALEQFVPLDTDSSTA